MLYTPPMKAKEEDLEKFKNHPRQKLAAMTWSLDENVGKLLAIFWMKPPTFQKKRYSRIQ